MVVGAGLDLDAVGSNAVGAGAVDVNSVLGRGGAALLGQDLMLRHALPHSQATERPN